MKKIFAVAVLTAVFTVSGFAQVQTEKVVTTGSSGRAQCDSTSYELSLHDFFSKNLTPMFRINTFMAAANYRMTDISRKFAADFGPFFWLSDGNYDLGLRASGYYYFARSKQLEFTLQLREAGL